MNKMTRQEKIRKNFRSIASLAIIFGILGSFAVYSFGNQETALAAPDSTVYFEPATASVGLNSDFTLDVMINPGTNQVNGVGLRIAFDPTKFRLDSISNVGSPLTVILPGASTDNSAGTASADFGIAAGSPSVTAISKVATLTFHSLAAVDSSSVSFSGSTYAVATGETVDVLTIRSAAAITVTSVAYGNADFAGLAVNWLKTGAGYEADLNSDEVVNTRDIGIMMSSWQ